MIIGVPMIFVGYRCLIFNMMVLGFCEGMSNSWNMLFAFYSSTQKQVENGVSHVSIIVTGCIVGLLVGTLALLFRKFSYILLGVIYGLCAANLAIEVIGSIQGTPMCMELTYPLT